MRVAQLRERWSSVARAEPRGRVLVWVSLGVTAGGTSALLLAVEHLTGAQRAGLLLGAVAGWIALVALAWARGRLPAAGVVAAIALTMACAVATPSHQSKDVFSYTMYGRIVTEHHRNPYNTYPMKFEGDPMRRYVSHHWQRTPDIYGPAFTVVMAIAAPVIGESTFLARFVYQLIAVTAMVALLWVLWRRTRSPTVLAFVGLHPLASVSVVNGGHPDVIVALAFVVAYFLALERRVELCGIALVAAVAINFSVIFAAVGLGAWAAWRWTRTEIVRLGAIVLGFGAAPYLLLTGWLDNAREHQELISRHSVWQPLTSIATFVLPVGESDVRHVMPNATTLMSGALLLLAAWRHSRRRTPDVMIVAALAVFLATSPWVMPWYAFPALPFLAMRKPTVLTWSVTIYSALILVGDQFVSLSYKDVGTVLHHTAQSVMPIVACAACVYAIVRRPRDEEVPALPARPSRRPAPAVA
jgi:hypothetical protein